MLQIQSVYHQTDGTKEKLTIYNNSEKAVEQRLETLVSCGDNLVKHLQNKHSNSCEHVFIKMKNTTISGDVM